MRGSLWSSLCGSGACALAISALALSGCGDEQDAVPAACSAGIGDVRAALEAAPGRVTLDGEPLTACLGDEVAGGTLSSIGGSYLGAAMSLADEAADRPEGAAAVQLGYLVGALGRSERGSQGVGYELGRRIRMELDRVDTRARAFRRGLLAGRRTG